MVELFEFGKWESLGPLGHSTDGLRKLLNSVWLNNKSQSALVDDETQLDNSEYQPFLTIDGNKIRARNYVGFIQSDENLIELWPKVFKYTSAPGPSKSLMLSHLFYWFGFCRKWKFPLSTANLSARDIDHFPELIISLFANQAFKAVSELPLSMYQPLEEALQTPRGRVNFSRYITNGLATGNFHKIDCDHEPFLYDNKVNRVIKYCCRLLIKQAKLAETQQVLLQTIFVLDEVEDISCSHQELDAIALNPLFYNYVDLLDSCKMILRNQLYSSHQDQLSHWCLLFPMEYIYEDFLAGFLQDKFSKLWKVEYQKSDLYLAKNEDGKPVFNLQQDIFLTSKINREVKVIVDAKYKLRDKNYKTDPKKGISQSDLYQMVSYALKRGCNQVLLLYPNSDESTGSPRMDKFFIESHHQVIQVIAAEVPFWSIHSFEDIEECLHDHLEHLLAQYIPASVKSFI